MSDELLPRLATFVAQNFLFQDDASGLDPEASLFETGVVDSTGVLEVVAFVEQEFGFTVRDAELVPANFETLHRLEAYVERRLAEQG